VLGGLLTSALAFLNRYTSGGLAAAALLTLFVLDPRMVGVVVYAFTSSTGPADLASAEVRLISPALYALLLIPFREGVPVHLPQMLLHTGEKGDPKTDCGRYPNHYSRGYPVQDREDVLQ
jgi:hypothetical protein